MLKIFKLPIAISVAAHVGLVVLLAWGAYYFRAIDYILPGGGGGGGSGSGGGGIVSVWVEVPEKSVASSHAASSALKSQAVQVPTSAASAPAANSGAEGSGDGSSAGGSSGGTGFGVGAGAGEGRMDPVLAEIWKKINRAKNYPEIAKRQGLEGNPKITFAINADGSVKSVELAKSSGEPMLDDAALATIKNAAPYPFYPQPITIAVRYSLK